MIDKAVYIAQIHGLFSVFNFERAQESPKIHRSKV